MQSIIGLMSGTSMDAVDAALCRFDGTRWHQLVATHSQPYPDELRRELLDLQRAPDTPRPLRHWIALDEAVARHFAAAATALMSAAGLSPRDILALGSHGQTVFHDPRGLGSSWQLGNPNRIAALTGVTTVADFRRADIAHGGEGAPLVPAFHAALFARAEKLRCVLNVGGIANVTILPAAAQRPSGFDTGPGNALMDEWYARHHGTGSYDQDGTWARSGTLRIPLLDTLLADPYFAQPPPKSTGRDYFNLDWALHRFPDLERLPAVDVQCTFAELTARSASAAILERGMPSRVLVCGGGVQNGFLMERLRASLPGTTVEATDAHGLDSRWVEASAFAWLAASTLAGQAGNLPTVTGAQRAVVLGGIYQASGRDG